jgi:hypothetical protein
VPRCASPSLLSLTLLCCTGTACGANPSLLNLTLVISVAIAVGLAAFIVVFVLVLWIDIIGIERAFGSLLVAYRSMHSAMDIGPHQPGTFLTVGSDVMSWFYECTWHHWHRVRLWQPPAGVPQHAQCTRHQPAAARHLILQSWSWT